MKKHLLVLAAILAAVFVVPVHPQGGITVRDQIYVSSDPNGACTNTQANQYNYTNNKLWGCNNGTWTVIVSGGGGSGTVTSIATTSPITGGTITSTGTIACGTCTVTVASGTVSLGTTTVNTGTCSSAIDGGTATGVLTTDTIIATANADPTGVTGYTPATTGTLYVWAYPTADHVNFKLCNNTASNITPGSAVTLNWRVSR